MSSGGPPRPTPAVAALDPYQADSTRRRGLLRLDFNENTEGPSPRVLERLRRLDGEDLALYPDETAAACTVRRQFSLGDDLDLVLVPGTDEGIRLVFGCFVEPGQLVLRLEPGFSMYRFHSTLAGAAPLVVDYLSDFSFPDAALDQALARRPRLVILADPNNPTGTAIPGGVVDRVASRLPDTTILIDEAYAEFAGRTSIALLSRHPNLLIARTFSKAHGLAGLRAGVLLGRRETISWLQRARGPYAVNSLALLAIEAGLEDTQYSRDYVAQVSMARDQLRSGLSQLGIESYPSEANFVVGRFAAAKAVQAALKGRGILVRDRADHPILADTLRIGVGTPAQMERFLAALGEVLVELGGTGMAG